jgi:hypothetical protein
MTKLFSIDSGPTTALVPDPRGGPFEAACAYLCCQADWRGLPDDARLFVWEAGHHFRLRAPEADAVGPWSGRVVRRAHAVLVGLFVIADFRWADVDGIALAAQAFPREGRGDDVSRN